jgi:hypothetical protein
MFHKENLYVVQSKGEGGMMKDEWNASCVEWMILSMLGRDESAVELVKRVWTTREADIHTDRKISKET